MARFWLSVFLAFWATLSTAQPRPDFTGTWRCNLSESRLESPAPDSSTFEITHRDPSFRLKVTQVVQGQPNTWEIGLTTDGKEVEQKESDGTLFRVRLIWDRDALIFDGYWLDGPPKTTNVVRYTLSKDGNVFTADERLSGAEIQHHNIWVFDRQK